ncbi:phosphopyruvate hydratase [candidate division CPR3 bacterium GWF2_35_18]|uniref:Enolase n=1 Tax=candidate division CPR3 bacterium GW2011_GWF2_35_18 TaxID=1618350 RepID=A0A0G0EP84_UNCC3|nr:MAG: Enolase [candidate division CPR3 bacterium GW2011_GWF2_35_18]OGB63818.1 MAG: phosphopyruvate hydratase [candidate division CPR3 bacterium GWF2_35_18]OGB65205.1 MAG: phosphopyruvate hydratase [candidate division CPR3 bacterium RIFOXYA2_FULL_35_13]OGB79408.1 MAG: phosphopyruvate hydratase [candidate division CPR3 bacterium RIFOXYB2_FULL_35_8]
MKITNIKSYEILASGGYPTIETRVELDNGVFGVASVPYGASAGSHEATVLTDNDKSRWNGKGMLKAVNNINKKITHLIKGLDPEDQRALDQKMIEADGTENKAKFGGNAILSVSIAVANAVANAKKIPLYQYIIDSYKTSVDLEELPQPMVVVIEGGKHADNTTDLQEFCFTALGNKSVAENLRIIMESYHALKNVLKSNNLSINVGNEGAFAPNGIPNNEAPFNFMLAAIKNAGYEPGKDVGISIDAAASEFFKNGKYHLSIENKSLNSNELISYYENWLQKYPIVTIEDMLHEDDWNAWVKLNEVAKKYKIELIGDDLTVTNMQRVQKAINLKAISAVLIKLNQIGTLTETVDCCMLARKNNLMTTTSHRGGGETNDTTMVDVAVAVGSRFIKVGPTRGERISKYNRLMEIERGLD